jgi:hypothetical protein
MIGWKKNTINKNINNQKKDGVRGQMNHRTKKTAQTKVICLGNNRKFSFRHIFLSLLLSIFI